MRHPIPVVATTAVLSTALHLSLGWGWTLAAGIVAGSWKPSRGWLWGMMGVALGWTGLTAYSAATAPEASRVLLDLAGALGGNIPGGLLIGTTVFLGAVLGALGGGIGALAAPMIVPIRRSGSS